MTAGSAGKCLGNDSRCGPSAQKQCQSLARQGTDCRWRAAFSVLGSMKIIASEPERLVSSPGAQLAVAKGIANATGIPAPYVDVDLTVDALRRRLRASSTGQGGVVSVTYVVSVGGDAPASITTTGEDVSSKLDGANVAVIGAAISASVDESLGAGSFALAVQDVNVADVVVQGVVSITSTSSSPEASSSTSVTSLVSSSSTSPAPTTSSTQVVSSTSHMHASTTMEMMSGGRCDMSPSLVLAMCTVFASAFFVQ